MYMTLVWWPKRKRVSTKTASRTERPVILTDKQWSLVAKLFPWTPPSKKGGRPKAHPRDCLEGILWILVTGARWKDLPKEYPSKATCHRRFPQWTIEGRILSAWQIILERMGETGQIDFSETVADGTFASAKKRGRRVGPTRRGKGTKVIIFVDRHGTPVAIDTESTRRSEVKLIEQLLAKNTLQNRQPERLVYDKAADSDPLRKRLLENNIDLICPHRKSRVKPPTQDCRKLPRFKRRWIVERSIAWLHNYRRIVTRWEYHDYLYESFVILDCLFTLLKRF